MSIIGHSNFMHKLRKAQDLKRIGSIDKTTSNEKIIELIDIKKKRTHPSEATIKLRFALGFRNIRGTRMADFIVALLKEEDLNKFGGSKSEYMDVVEVNNGMTTKHMSGRGKKRKIIQLNEKVLNNWLETGIIRKSNKKLSVNTKKSFADIKERYKMALKNSPNV